MIRQVLLCLFLPCLSFAQQIHFEPIDSEIARSLVFRSILEDSLGQIWYGTIDQGIVRQAGDVFEKLIPPINMDLVGAASIHEAKDGSLYFSGRGVFKIQEGVLSKVELAGLKSSVVFNMTEDENGLWFLGNRGAAYLSDQGRWTGFFAESELSDRVVHDGQYDTAGNFWLATRRGGLDVVDPDGKWTNLLPNTNCRKILRSSNGDMWIGSSAGILHYAANSERHSVYREGEILLPEFESPDGSIWFSSETTGIWKFSDGSFEQISTEAAFTLRQLSTGEILIGAASGLKVLARND